MKYAVHVFRLEGKRRVLIAEDTWDANEDVADEIGEYAGGMIAEAVRCDVALLMEKKS